jgi:hypothetical protein
MHITDSASELAHIWRRQRDASGKILAGEDEPCGREGLLVLDSGLAVRFANRTVADNGQGSITHGFWSAAG